MLVTGLPGCGKSTLVNQLLTTARQKGIEVGGVSTPEFRTSAGKRRGFLIQDVATGKEQVMASVELASPVSVGRYGVNLEAIRNVGVTAIDSAITGSDLVVIDEIGKMELAVPEFLSSVRKALDSSKPVLGTIGVRLKTPFAVDIKTRADVTLLRLTPQNRSQIYQDVKNLVGL